MHYSEKIVGRCQYHYEDSRGLVQILIKSTFIKNQFICKCVFIQTLNHSNPNYPHIDKYITLVSKNYYWTEIAGASLVN